MSLLKPGQPYKGTRVLVTGAGGFIGSRLAKALIEAGADVSGIVRTRGHAELLAPIAGDITLYEGNLEDPLEARQIIAGSKPEVVFNAASSTDTRRIIDIMDSAIAGTYRVTQSIVDACIAGGVRKLVHFGTIEEYGTNAAPFFETMREDPVSPYSLGKIMATQAVLLAGRLAPLKTCVLRPAATFGPGKSFTMLIPSLIKAGIEGHGFDMNDGEQLRDFVYVDDVAAGALAAGLKPDADGEIINLGSGRGMKVRAVAEMVNEAMGNPIRINFGVEAYRPFDSESFYMNSDKARRILGWQASSDMKGALAETVRWYREHYSDSR